MGLNPTHSFKRAGDVADGGGSDRDGRVDLMRRSDGVRTTERSSRTCLIMGVITAEMRSGGEHRDRWIAIQRR